MEEPKVEATPKEDRSAGFALASLSVLYVMVCLCLVVVFVFVARQNIPFVRDYFPAASPTASRTPFRTPTPKAHEPASGDKVTKDDFSENKENWHSKWSGGTVSIKNGQLILSGSQIDKISITQCNICTYFHDSFYIEADFSTSQTINERYGFVFNIKDDSDKFYSFQVNAQQGYYVLYKKTKTKDDSKNLWMKRTSKDSNLINPYPKSNKLAVAFNKDVIELYINGILVETYQDSGTSLTSGDYGFYVDGGGFDLMVDNLFTYGK